MTNTERLAALYGLLRDMTPEESDALIAARNQVDDPLYLEARMAAYECVGRAMRGHVEDLAYTATQMTAERLAVKQNIDRRKDAHLWQDVVYTTFGAMQPLVKDATFAAWCADTLQPVMLVRLMAPFMRVAPSKYGPLVPRTGYR